MSPVFFVIVIVISLIVPGLIILSLGKHLPAPSLKVPVSLIILCIVTVVFLGIFSVAYYFVGPMILLYLMFAALVLVGPILLFVGLWKLSIRLYKLLRCRLETEGQIVDYVLSPWKRAPMNTFHRHNRYYTSRWFPVVEYEVAGQRFRRKNKTCIVCNERPEEKPALVRYNPKHPKRFYMPSCTTDFTFFGWTGTWMFLFVGGGFTYISALIVSNWILA